MTTVPIGGVAVPMSATIVNAPNQGFNWQVDGIAGGNASVGTISASGVYVSPAAMPASPTVTITAVSAANSADSGSVSLTLAPDMVTVTVAPSSASVLAGSGSQTFVATVTGTTITAVTWQVNGVTGGNSATGTISATGLYTAPATQPAQSIVTVGAVSVEDPSKSASASVTVNTQATAPPTISGTPPTSVVAGHAYTFTPTASSPRGAVLTFSITNMPSWAAFNSATGQLSGTPASANMGTYANVAISVNDGTASASLAPFTITVQPGTTGTATLSWTPPTTRTDGSALTNLAGFNIYYGTSPGTYPIKIALTNPGVTTYVVSSLPGGSTYYFVATAYDSSGAESGYSNIGSKTIP